MLKVASVISAFLCAGTLVGDEYDDYQLKVVEESKDVDAFENGSFEDGAKRGSIDKYREIGSFGVNGGGGLRIRPNNGRIYHGLKLNENRLIKGNRYVFSADVKMVGNVGGVIALDTYFKGTNKTAPGCSAWGTCREKKDADGWEHQSVELVAKHDQEKLDYKFIVYGRVGQEDPTNPVNCVCVDNLRIDLVAPKWYLANTWPAYNLVHKDEGRIRFNSTFWGNFLEKDSEAVYGCRLRTAEGRELGRTYVRPDANGNFTADFGNLAYEGPAKVAVTLYDRTHRLNRGTREIDVTVRTPDRDKGLFATENGVVLKDGKPYLALGFYTNLAHPDKHDMKSVERHMKLLSEAGFNVIMDYSAYMLHGARRDQFYALAAKYGIGVIDDTFNKNTDYAPGKAREATAKKIREIAAHPAHVGWYTMDEAPENAVPQLSGLRRLLNEESPGKFVNTCNIMRAAPYLPTADAQGGDCYPVRKNSNGTLEEPNRRVKAVADCRPAAIWYAPQCYNWARMIPGHHEAKVYLEQGREPTFMEMLSVALVMAMNDTTGFLFYSHFELLENPVKAFREQRWSDMVKIAKEMRELEPYLLSGEKKEELPHADRKEAVRVQGLSDGKGRRCVLVAGLFHDHETTFTLPAKYGRLKSRFGFTAFADGQWTFKAKEFVCDILEPVDAGEEWLSYRQVARGTPKPIAGIENADFEDSTKFGKSKDGKSEYGRFGYNGNGGCRMWIREKFKLFRFPSNCKLEKGRTYTFSGMYRAVGNARGVYSWMMLVDGKYRKEKGGLDIEDLGDGWKRGAVTFTPECDGSTVVNCLDFQATPLRKMSEEEARSDRNYIDFDNLQIVEAIPVWRFCNVWPIQNRVYKEGGRVRCRNSFVGDFFEKDAQPFYVAKLVAADGRTLAQRLCRDKDGVFTCAFGDLAYEGAAELVVALYDRRNRLGYGEKRVPVTVVPTPKPANGRPFITEAGRTLVNGEPFMPLGFWTGLGQICLTNRAEFVRQLEMLHGAGFNAIVEYNGYLLTKKDDRDFFYDQCDRNGIRIFDGDMALASWDELNRKPDGAERYRAKSLVYRDYPAIFAWFVTDECSADRVPALMAMRRILSETTPNIPMWPCNIFEPDPFLPGQDVQGGDLYPYRDATSTLKKADQSLAAFEACRPAACWHSPQCYNWQEMKKQKGISAEDYLKGEPGEDQMLSVAVLMASRSVTGFLFYSHFNLWRPSPAGDLGPTRWARMKNIARTMNALKPFITSGVRRVEVPHVDRGDPTRVVALSDGQGHSRLLVIGLGLKHDCEIDLSQVKGLAGRSQRGKTTLKDGKAVFRGTGMSCDILE